MNYKNISILMTVIACLLFGACTDKWEDEQYEQYVSFKAPVEWSSVARLRLKYRDDSVHYRLPLIVSGTMMNERDVDVHVGLDRDTLLAYNQIHFGEGRKDLWFRELEESRYVYNPVTRIPAGECTSLIDIQFDFRGIDLSEKWMLPLVVQDNPSFGYQSNPKLGYNRALLWLTLFNDYSGTYGTSTLDIYVEHNSQKQNVPNRTAHVVDENSVFFYAGAIEENRPDRKYFKVKVSFCPDETFVPKEGSTEVEVGTVKLEAMNPIAGLDFRLLNETPMTYVVTETMDRERPTLMRRVTTVKNVHYTFNDPRERPGHSTFYEVKGTMSLQRRINTIIPDEEFAIEWD